MKILFENQTAKRLEKEVQSALKLNNFRLFKISKSLLLIANNDDIVDIAELFQVNTRTIYNWVSRFMVERFSWLLGLHYRGRGAKSKLPEEQKKKIYALVVAGPTTYGFD